MTFETPLAVAAVFFIAGLFKGLLGLGLPVVSMALLTFLMSPGEAAKALAIPAHRRSRTSAPARCVHSP